MDLANQVMDLASRVMDLDGAVTQDARRISQANPHRKVCQFLSRDVVVCFTASKSEGL
jgi:hypothetical protein